EAGAPAERGGKAEERVELEGQRAREVHDAERVEHEHHPAGEEQADDDQLEPEEPGATRRRKRRAAWLLRRWVLRRFAPRDRALRAHGRARYPLSPRRSGRTSRTPRRSSGS